MVVAGLVPFVQEIQVEWFVEPGAYNHVPEVFLEERLPVDQHLDVVDRDGSVRGGTEGPRGAGEDMDPLDVVQVGVLVVYLEVVLSSRICQTGRRVGDPLDVQLRHRHAAGLAHEVGRHPGGMLDKGQYL